MPIEEICTEVTVYYLQMTDRRQLQAKPLERTDFTLQQVQIPLPELNRFFYASVGVDWYWTDRLYWTYQQWQNWLEKPGVSTWVGYLSGTPIGYFELAEETETETRSVELAYFGLLPKFTGRGLGGPFLSCALEKAWRLNPERVWLHTCSLDHPGAIANYRARGFQLYQQHTLLQKLPAQSLELWPGANS